MPGFESESKGMELINEQHTLCSFLMKRSVFYAKDKITKCFLYNSDGLFDGLCHDLLQYFIEYWWHDEPGIPDGIWRNEDHVACSYHS